MGLQPWLIKEKQSSLKIKLELLWLENLIMQKIK